MPSKRFLNTIIILAAALLTVIVSAHQPVEPPCCVMPQPIPPGGGVFTNPEWMSIDFHRVNIEVENQIVVTNVDMQFTNNGEGFVEGTFLFPLPQDAAVDNLVMYIDGQAIEAKILPADEARAIYNEIVRQYRDPALLEYVGMNTLQANVFPIPPGESRRIEIGYSQILEAENGLLKLSYPMALPTTKDHRVNSMSVSVDVRSTDAIRNIYSPTHDIAISRNGDEAFRVGFERNNYTPDGDFVLYYGLENERISVNLLSYRESANEDGFFMLLVQPPVSVPQEQVVPKDVILVIDQSGSMDGVKWQQAQAAATYVLENLNEGDRFNVVAFSTGWRIFSSRMESANSAPEAAQWVNGMFSEGGTDINGALLTALDFADAERPVTILFMTDGLATEGVVDTPSILQNLRDAAGRNVRIFTFGVGDDVDTVLLDSITREFRGASSYVRPTERIEEEVASLYNKVSAPVLTDVVLEIDGVRTDLVYPQGQLPDLFAGEQLTIVGRYRQGAENVTVSLRGEVNGQATTYTYSDLAFTSRAGGEPFIARLWATRRIGELLNTIRLNGESEELIDSVVNLSVRYGIITPYTSFLIEEDDILSQQGRDRAMESFSEEAAGLSSNFTGSSAVTAADEIANLAAAQAPSGLRAFPTQTAPSMPAAPPAVAPSGGGGFFNFGRNDSAASVMPQSAEAEALDFEGAPAQAPAPQQAPVLNVQGKTFLLQNGIYVDTTFSPDDMQTVKIAFLSDAYFELLLNTPALGEYLAIGDALIIVWEGVAYEITPE